MLIDTFTVSRPSVTVSVTAAARWTGKEARYGSEVHGSSRSRPEMSRGDDPLVVPIAYDALGLYGAAWAPSRHC